MALFERIKTVDPQTKDIVNWFIRNSQILLPNDQSSFYNIPSLVFMITTLYYFNPEYFTNHGQYMQLNDKKKTVHTTKCYEPNTAYGNIIITKQDRGIFIWTFLISDPPVEVVVEIGLQSSAKTHTNTSITRVIERESEHSFYGLSSYDDGEGDCSAERILKNEDTDKQSWWKGNFRDKFFGDVFTEDDHTQLRMELNMNDKTIKYYIDGEDQGIAFDDICFDNDEQYVMFVCVDEPMSVELVDFQHVFN